MVYGLRWVLEQSVHPIVAEIVDGSVYVGKRREGLKHSTYPENEDENGTVQLTS